MGWNTRELRVEKSPSATGSAEQWVREKFVRKVCLEMTSISININKTQDKNYLSRCSVIL